LRTEIVPPQVELLKGIVVADDSRDSRAAFFAKFIAIQADALESDVDLQRGGDRLAGFRAEIVFSQKEVLEGRVRSDYSSKRNATHAAKGVRIQVETL